MSGAFFGGRRSRVAERNEQSRERRRDEVERDLERLKDQLSRFSTSSPIDAPLFENWIKTVDKALLWVATSR